MNNLIPIISQYLLKGGFLTLVTYFLGNIKSFVKSALWQSIIQVLILSAALFVLDWIVPRFLPQTQSQGMQLPPQIQQVIGGQNPAEMLQNVMGMFQPKQAVQEQQ